MAGPKPQIANGRLAISYTCGSLGAHTCDLDVYISSPHIGDDNTLGLNGGGVIPWRDAVDRFVLKAKPMFDSTATLTTAVLKQYVGGAWVPLSEYSIGVAGTGSGGVSPATQETYTFRDVDRNLDKIVFLEQGSSVPLHLFYGTLGASRKSFVDDVLNTASPAIGSWYVSKANLAVKTFHAVTTTYNRALRRKRGQV